MNAISNPAGFINREWSTRPDDQRFVSLPEMLTAQFDERSRSATRLLDSNMLEFSASDERDPNAALLVQSKGGKTPAKMTNFAFGQLCRQVGAPASYLATLPAAMVADNLNYGFSAEPEESKLGLLLTNSPDRSSVTVRAANGAKYGRIHNCDVTREVISRYGDGLTGQYRQPGEFGKAVEITKANCTLYSGDRTMTIFLCDEENRVEVPNRRDGKTGSLARGFFVWNSEVGAATLGVGSFWFDYVCMNRNIWGMQEYSERTIRHTSNAGERWLNEVLPVLISAQEFDPLPVLTQIKSAQALRVENAAEFLAKRFTKKQAALMMDAHKADEGRPIETIFDASNAATAFARTIPYQIERIEVERAAGQIMKLAA